MGTLSPDPGLRSPAPLSARLHKKVTLSVFEDLQDDDEIAPSTDSALQQLLITVTNATNPVQLSGEPRKSFLQDTLLAAPKLHLESGAVIRFRRCIDRIIEQKRKQFVHHRLQWLVFQYKQRPPMSLELPEQISSPRNVQDPNVRLQWWGHARGHPNAARKAQGQALPPIARSAGNGKLSLDQTETGDRGSVVELRRATRHSYIQRSVSKLQDGDVATAARVVAAVSKGSPDMATPTIAQRLRHETRKSMLANAEETKAMVEVLDVSHKKSLREGKKAFGFTDVFGGNAASKKAASKGPTSKPQQPTLNRSVTQIKEQALLPATVFTSNVQDKVKMQEEGVLEAPFLPTKEEEDEDRPKLAAKDSEPAKGAFLTEIILDAAGGFLSPNVVINNENTARKSPRPESSASDTESPEVAMGMAVTATRASLAATMPTSTIKSAAEQADIARQASDIEETVIAEKMASRGAVSRRDRRHAVSNMASKVKKKGVEVSVERDVFSMDGLMNNQLRFGVAWNVVGRKEEHMPSILKEAMRSSPSRDISHPYRSDKSRGSLLGQQAEAPKYRSEATEYGLEQRNWGDDFEKDCLRCPKPSVKSTPQKLRQQRIDSKLQLIHWDRNRRRCTPWIDLKRDEPELRSRSSRVSSISSTSTVKVMLTSDAVNQEDVAAAVQALPHCSSVSTLQLEDVAAAVQALPHCSSVSTLQLEDVDDASRSVKRSSSAPGISRLAKPAQTRAVQQRAPGDPGRTKGRPAAFAYLDDVATRWQVPHIPKCLQDSSDGVALQGIHDVLGDDEEKPVVTALDLRYLNLTNSEALPIITGLKKQSADFDALLMPGNSQLSDAIITKLITLVASRSRATGVKLLRLDFAGTTGMGDTALTLLSTAMRREFHELKYLRMNGVCISDRMWSKLQGSMQSLIRLEDLHFSDMQIGRASQYSATCVAESLPGMPALSNLDLSCNFFGLQGCKALASSIRDKKNLANINLSFNAGGFVSSVCGVPDKNPFGEITELRFNPISLVCEAIAQAPSLKVLNLSNCQLNYDEDFILEDAMADKIGDAMEELDLSGNPCQGQFGARCLVRMAISTCTLDRLNVKELKEALPTETSIPYEFSDPSAQYSIDLSYPQHRALLRTLLRRSRVDYGCKTDSEITGMLQFANPALGGEIVRSWAGGRGLPDEGSLMFSFSPPQVVSADQEEVDIMKLISNVKRTRKLRVTLYTFVKVAELFRNLIDEAGRRTLINAIASDLLMKLCHVKYLSLLDTRLSIEVIERLMPAVDNLDRMDGFDLIITARGLLAPSLHVAAKPSLQLLLFNPYAPTAHYCLDMLNPADRHILETLLIINSWDRARATADKKADLSQHGGHECLRNVMLNHRDMEWDSEKSAMPSRGEFEFDYVTPSHASIDVPTTHDAVFQAVVGLITESSVDPLPKVAVLRALVHRLVLSPDQVADLINTLPPSPKSDEEAAARARISPRVDAFVTLYPRCVDIPGLLSSSPQGLYGLKMLARPEVLSVRKRLGRLRTWDLNRCDVDWIVPNRLEETKMRWEIRVVDADKMAGLLAGLKLYDDTTSQGNANRYVLDLAVFEDWMCACVLMQVAIQEPGAHWDDPSWSETAHLEERGAKWLVPNEWANNLPNVGLFKVRYFLERENYVDPEFRKKMGQKYLGW